MHLAKRKFEQFLCESPLAYAYLRTLCGAKDWEKPTFLKTIRPGTEIELGVNLEYFTNLFQLLVGTIGQLHDFEPLFPPPFSSSKALCSKEAIIVPSTTWVQRRKRLK